MPYVPQVQILADEHRREFGFLPGDVYGDAAIRGNLWVAVDTVSRAFRGYLHFGGRHPRMKVFQICVVPEHRSSGTARRIISKFLRYSQDLGYLNITARVLSTLAANRFWQQQGFHIVRQEPGKRSESTINLYSKELDGPSLFANDRRSQSSVERATIRIDPGRPLLPTPSYVIDLNVFFDVVRSRDTGQAAQILCSALSHEIRLFVTTEFVQELERASQNQSNDPVLSFARNLPTLPRIEPNRLEQIVTDLRELLVSAPPGPRKWSTSDKADHTHIASSIHHRAFGFITSDSAVLRASEAIHKKYGLRVVSPSDVVDSLGTEDSSIHVPMSITAETREIRVSDIHEGNHDSVLRFLSRRGNDAYDGALLLGEDPGHSGPRSIVVSCSEQIVGVGLWSATAGSGRHAILNLLIDEDQPDADRAIDHVLWAAGRTGDRRRLWRCTLRIPRDQLRTRETALKRGFHPLKNRDVGEGVELVRVSTTGVVVSEDWRQIARDFLDETSLRLPDAMPSYQELINTGIVLGRGSDRGSWTMSLFDFETFISPGALIAPHRGAVIVPIKETYAAELLPETARQPSLVSQYDAAFRLERAYFLRAGRHTLLPRGMLVVFYVSRKRSQAVALARVTFAETLTKTQAVLNLSRQGVLTEAEIQQRANDRNEITVFTFDNVLKFPKGIDFTKLKQMGCVSGANLVTAQEISDEALECIVRDVFGAAK